MYNEGFDPNVIAASFGAMFWFIMIAFYFFFAWTQYKIAQKCNCDEQAWWSFIPIMNVVLFCKMGNKPLWWTVMFFLPILHLYAIFVTAVQVAQNAGHHWLWGICLGLPGLNIIASIVLAFTGEAPNYNRVAPTPPTYDHERTPTNVG